METFKDVQKAVHAATELRENPPKFKGAHPTPGDIDLPGIAYLDRNGALRFFDGGGLDHRDIPGFIDWLKQIYEL